MKKVLRLRLLSVMLVMVLIAQVLSVAAFASGNEETVSEPTNVTETPEETTQEQPEYETVLPQMTPSMGLKAGDKTLEELSLMTVDLATLPELIDPAVALEKGHVNRLHLQETSSNTVMYQNKNGTKTTYLFANPVKYIDGNGNIKDKSSAVSAVLDDTYSYAMQSNSVKAYFPKTSSQNTLVTYGTYGIGMTPKDTAASPASYDANSKKIVYPYAFGENTLLVYTTQLDGLKEDIVLVKNIGVNEFVFDMTLSGLTPYFESGIWYLKNSQNETIGNFGKILINDSAGNMAVGEMSVTQIGGNGKYEVKITAPEEFLNSEDTVYPVYIDPTVRIYEDGFCTYTDEYGDPVYVDYDAIIDIGLYDNAADASFHLSQTDYHSLGKTTNGEGRIIYRLYDFYGQYGQYKDILDWQIGSVKLHAKLDSSFVINSENKEEASIYVYPMLESNGNDGSISINGSVIFQQYSEENSSITTINLDSEEIVVDITDIARSWAQYNTGAYTDPWGNPANGFVMSADTTTGHRVCSVEKFATSNVYVVIDIAELGGIYYINNVSSQGFLYVDSDSENEDVKVADVDNNEEIVYEEDKKFLFEYVGNDTYLIKSITLDKYLYVYAAGNIDLVEGTDDITDNYLWHVQWKNSGGYVIKNVATNKVLSKGNNSSTSNDNPPVSVIAYPQTVTTNISWLILPAEEYKKLSQVRVLNCSWLDVGQVLHMELSCVPSDASLSRPIHFNLSSSDPSVATVTKDGTINAKKPGKVKIVLEHKYTQAKYEFGITVGQVVPNGQYHIRNVQTGLYLGVGHLSEDEYTPVEQIEFPEYDIGGWEYWNITYLGNGYYNVVNGYSYAYMSANLLPYTNVPSVHQKYQQDTTNRWRILYTSSGAYRFVPECFVYDNYALCAPDYSDGSDCDFVYFADNNSYFDEWSITKIEYRVNARVLQDKGYMERYVGSEHDERFPNLFRAVELYFADKYFIRIEFSSPELYESCADSCEHSYKNLCCSDILGPCEYTDDGKHHRDIGAVLSDIPTSVETSAYAYEMPQNITILFCGNALCLTENGEHKASNCLGLAFAHEFKLFVNNYNSEEGEILTTIHEIGHMFWIVDHYEAGQTAQKNSEAGEEIYSDNCIYGMNREYDHISQNAVMCEGCLRTLQRTLDTALDNN